MGKKMKTREQFTKERIQSMFFGLIRSPEDLKAHYDLLMPMMNASNQGQYDNEASKAKAFYYDQVRASPDPLVMMQMKLGLAMTRTDLAKQYKSYQDCEHVADFLYANICTNPSNLALYYSFIPALDMLGRYDDAYVFCDILARLSPIIAPKVYAHKAWMLTKQGRIDQAISIYKSEEMTLYLKSEEDYAFNSLIYSRMSYLYSIKEHHDFAGYCSELSVKYHSYNSGIAQSNSDADQLSREAFAWGSGACFSDSDVSSMGCSQNTEFSAVQS